MRFRKKPVEIEAVQWTGYNAPALKLFAGKNVKFVGDIPEIHTPEGRMMVQRDNWIVKDIHGEFSLCDPVVFLATHESD